MMRRLLTLLPVVVFLTAQVSVALVAQASHAIRGGKKIQADFARAHAITDVLARDYGIAIVHVKDKMPRCRWRVRYSVLDQKDAGDGRVLLSYARMLDQEFRKYPRAFVKASNIKALVLVQSLKLGYQLRAAIPDYHAEVLYLDIGNSPGRSTYRRHTLHHEYYHMLEQEVFGSGFYKDPKWKRLNERKFRYGRGGANMRGAGVGRLNHPRLGFVNTYATSGVEEDKAETWAIMFTASEWKRVSPWLRTDDILARKIAFLEAFAMDRYAGMDHRFWRRLRHGRNKR